ncbi:MAG: UDP-N-acetylmuramate dehydrogenase [Bacteroidales bacterium]|jgi:UDP-N-acetylmuramate dehydrogenase|nr:UDP-N-acetylmuramate dehydrogenase [Bacteroidales bacterium]MDY0196330.1 UDP-N-acetylmuramate dehydrogenase [Tenuifilaceae bacterium]
MYNISHNFCLKPLNTFGIDVKSEYYIEIQSIDDLREAIKWVKDNHFEWFVLGGGSNVLFKGDFKGVVIKPGIVGIDVVAEDEQSISIKVGAGVEWDNLVEYAVNSGLGGIENLSLIPGSVGASPIQNIGAYGVEAKDTIEYVEGVYIDTLKSFKITKDECKFDYRDSIFKNELKGKVIITHVVFRLSKTPKLIVHYGNLEEELKLLGGMNIANVRKAVSAIRNSKLPDPKEIGNAGSFFKNPVVDITLVEDLQEKFDKVPYYPVNENLVKLPAGWLIEQCGWKGKQVGRVGVHKMQALVLVNHGGCTGNEVIDLAHRIRESVMEKFNVALEMEVNVI